MGKSPVRPGLHTLLSLTVLASLAGAQAVTTSSVGNGSKSVPANRTEPLVGPYGVLTDTRTEVANLNPEVFTGLVTDADGVLWALNPYASTVVSYSAVTPAPDLVVETGLHPVSVGIWDPGDLGQRKLLVVCTGTHALFVHDPADGRIEQVIRLDSEPGDMVIDQDNSRAFIACQGANTVIQVDLLTWKIAASYPIPCGERPGYLYLDRGAPDLDGDNRVYVGQSTTGNNSITIAVPTSSVGGVLDLDLLGGADLPDEDIFRIDPEAGVVEAVLSGAGSLIFQITRNPATNDLWVLSSDSNNKDLAIDSEPKLNGQVAINQLILVPAIDNASGLGTAGVGIDLDDIDAVMPGGQYDPTRSINQARALDILDANSTAPGLAFVASPMSDVIPLLDATGARLLDFQLPAGAQCYDVDVYDPDDTIVAALCLGTMTIELFQWSPFAAAPFASLPLGLDPTPAQIRRGRDVFLDGQRSESARFSCGTCHPGGRSDQLGWMLRGDPIDEKNVMVTQSLLSISDTFPHHWRGERELVNFQGAFGGLLGAPPAEQPTPSEMADFVVFMQTLQAPANPLQNPKRILDDSRGTLVAPNGHTGSAVNGQRWYQDVPNFNSNTCAECHTQETGSNGAFFVEVGTNAPRAANLEVAHLRQLQHKGSEAVTLEFGATVLQVNQNGFGLRHNGMTPTLFDFIVNISAFFALSEQQRVDVFRFVEQFDQGISPAAHWSSFFEASSAEHTPTSIRQVLLNGAIEGWNDVAVVGQYDTGAGLVPMRWLYNSGDELFISEDPAQAPIDWNEMVVATREGRARAAFIGLPVGNGRRFAIDHDADRLTNGQESSLGTDPWVADTDGDTWPDGYEAEHGDDPLVAQAPSADAMPPATTRVALDHRTSRTAKYLIQFSEQVTYTVDYGPLGSARVYQFTRDYFTDDDTFVLTHSDPSSPAQPAIAFDAMITMTDRNGNVTGPVVLPGFSPLETGEMLAPFLPYKHVAVMEWVQQVRNG
ncbi:MAG: mono/diheme cytochrome c family protein, partial [Gammaproteobacteria bacterium]